MTISKKFLIFSLLNSILHDRHCLMDHDMITFHRNFIQVLVLTVVSFYFSPFSPSMLVLNTSLQGLA
jgi:hypothetical protein